MTDGHGHFGHAHIAPPSMYYKVFVALIVGTVLTVAAAKVDMGPLNNVVMLLIAARRRRSSFSSSCTSGGARG